MTTGGLYGYVNAVEDETIWLEIAEGVEIRIAKAAVLKRIPLGADDAEADAVAGRRVVEHERHGVPSRPTTRPRRTSPEGRRGRAALNP